MDLIIKSSIESLPMWLSSNGFLSNELWRHPWYIYHGWLSANNIKCIHILLEMEYWEKKLWNHTSIPTGDDTYCNSWQVRPWHPFLMPTSDKLKTKLGWFTLGSERVPLALLGFINHDQSQYFTWTCRAKNSDSSPNQLSHQITIFHRFSRGFPMVFPSKHVVPPKINGPDRPSDVRPISHHRNLSCPHWRSPQ